jgi:hypothetical protein
MVATYRAEYDTCTCCGESVRHIVVLNWLGRLRSRRTTHIREIRDPAQRCKYDRGPELGSIALAAFPGDM